MTIKTTPSLMLALILVAIVTPALAESGIASIYGNGDGYAWKPTANCYRNAKRKTECERMDPRAMTAAHKTLPLGTRISVCHRSTGRCVTVRINDRGPFVRGRIVDLSPAAARRLGCDGLCNVTVQII